MCDRLPMTRRSVYTLVIAVCVLLGTMSCSAGRASNHRVSISISPSTELSDDPVSITVRGLAGGSRVSLGATATDASHVTWTSDASYKVPSNGVLTSGAPAISGSYTGVDPMGLLLTMVPPSCAQPPQGACALGSSAGSEFIAPRNGYGVRFTAKVGHSTVATATALRESALSSAVRDSPLRPKADGLYGELLEPVVSPGGRRPGIVLFGGSEGGVAGARYVGSQLAAHGYPVLALAYFDEPGLPQGLQNIPLEYFSKALGLLRKQPAVDPRHVFVYGASRGGELALLLAATYPAQVNGVIAGVPSSNVNGSYPRRDGVAWTLNGLPVPEGPIAVENIRGPILQTCATLDVVWDSCGYVSQISSRLTAHHFRYPVTTLRLEDAGHLAGAPSCCASITTAAGGTPSGNALAQTAGFTGLLRFLAPLR
jgi:dienelactone hydrolase